MEIVQGKTLRRGRGVKSKGVAKYSDYGPFQFYISETLQDMIQGPKLLLITYGKSHMSFRLVPNSVTLDDLERRNSPRCVISSNSVAFGRIM